MRNIIVLQNTKLYKRRVVLQNENHLLALVIEAHRRKVDIDIELSHLKITSIVGEANTLR